MPSADYRTYGNIAYAPEYDGAAVRAPRRRELERPAPQRRTRERVRQRPQVQVRQAERVAPLAVAGFLAAGIFAVLVIMSYVQLTVLNDQAVAASNTLSTLQEEEAKLLAQYEQAYDLIEIEAALTSSGAMAKPLSTQVYVIDLSGADSAEVWHDPAADSGGILAQIADTARSAAAYFH